MDKFVTDSILPLLTEPAIQHEQIIKQRVWKIEEQLKIFVSTQIKLECAQINKEMAKKSRQLFILSADNQSLKQTLNSVQEGNQELKNQYNMLEQQKTKQKLIMERQMAQFKKESDSRQKQLKAEITKIKNQKQLQAEQNAQKIRQMKREHQKQIVDTIRAQNQRFDEEKTAMNQEFQRQKSHIIADNNENKRQLIKKYEDRINKLIEDYENRVYLLQKQIEDDKKNTSRTKGKLQDRIIKLQNEQLRLTSQLNLQKNFHKKFEQDYHNTNKLYIQFQQQAASTKQNLQQLLHQTKKKLFQQQRKYIKDTSNLNKLLETTIAEKDKLFNDTVETMNIQHRIEVDSLRNQLMEEREIAVNRVEVQRQQDNYNNEIKYNQLNDQFQSLKIKYDRVNEDYKEKINQMNEDHENLVDALNMRRQYQLKVNDKNSERQLGEMRIMYQFKIKSLHQKHAQENIQLQKRFTEEKLGLGNKLTTQYQSMIADIRNSNQIQIKQKLIQFQRKAKGYEGKIKDSDKKKAQIKAQMQRVKMEMQMRIDSMLEVTETLQEEIGELNEKIKDLERQNQKIVNEYQLKILMLKNQMKQQLDQSQVHEEQLKELLQSKLKAKNQEIVLMTSKLNRQTKQLINRNEQRVKALEKEYNQLKRVMGQKTSIPEDIQALKVFHQAYLDKEEELAKQKKKVEYLKRQLMAKDAIDKVFAQKGQKIIFQVDEHSRKLSPYKTYQNLASTNKKKDKTPFFGAFKSAQIF